MASGMQETADDRQQFESQLKGWVLPPELVERLISYHTIINYPPAALIYKQGFPADFLFWVVKGAAKVYCPLRNGSRILVHAAGPGELLGHFDLMDEQSQWVRLFEAHSWTRCTLAMVTRQHVVKLAKSLDSTVLVELLQQMNTAWSSWLGAFASFLGLSFRDRLELVMRELGTKFGIQDKEGTLLALDPAHADLAEMIGSSRPMVSRLMSELIAEGDIGRRGKRYILLSGGRLAIRTKGPTHNKPAHPPVRVNHNGNGRVIAA